MCIVCEIKTDLSKSKATAEEGQAIVTKVEKLAGALASVLDLTQQINDRLPEAEKFSAEETDALAEAESLFLSNAEGLAGGLAGLLLAAILGGAKVETVRVEMQEGESIDEAIARTLRGNEASSQAFTKSTKLH